MRSSGHCVHYACSDPPRIHIDARVTRTCERGRAWRDAALRRASKRYGRRSIGPCGDRGADGQMHGRKGRGSRSRSIACGPAAGARSLRRGCLSAVCACLPACLCLAGWGMAWGACLPGRKPRAARNARISSLQVVRGGGPQASWGRGASAALGAARASSAGRGGRPQRLRFPFSSLRASSFTFALEGRSRASIASSRPFQTNPTNFSSHDQCGNTCENPRRQRRLRSVRRATKQRSLPCLPLKSDLPHRAPGLWMPETWPA